MFNIPIVLFLFKRDTGLDRIISRINEINPAKIYLIADGPRDKSEEEQCKICRKKAEALILPNTEIIRNYSDVNRGVLQNIGLGAKWVLGKEKWAIFLEDDNLPEITFFYYCEELLKKYETSEKILWICGTNYLNKFNSKESYFFTKHLLPCGWASWSNKFNQYYDENLDGLDDTTKLKNFKNSYLDKKLCKQQLYSVEQTRYFLKKDIRKSSWDYQMLFSVRANNMYGISPKYNQIENIGVDEFSIHNGTTLKHKMIKRFCTIKTFPLDFPLTHPEKIDINLDYETKIGNVLLNPIEDRIKQNIATIIKFIFKIDKHESLKQKLKKK